MVCLRERIRGVGLEEAGEEGGLMEVLGGVYKGGASSLIARVASALRMGGDDDLAVEVEDGGGRLWGIEKANDVAGACAAVMGVHVCIMSVSAGQAVWVEHPGGGAGRIGVVNLVQLFDGVYDALRAVQGGCEGGVAGAEGVGGGGKGGRGDLLDGLATQLDLLEARTR